MTDRGSPEAQRDRATGIAGAMPPVEPTVGEEDERATAQAGDPLTNDQLARVFHEIGDVLEVKGELIFKTVAYHRAADAIAKSPFEVTRAYRAGGRPPIPGVGKAISDKIEELARTGHLAYHERLLAEFPPTLIELLEVPGVGPKTVRLVYDALGVESLEDLRQAAEAGRLRSIRGMSEKTERSILDGIAQLAARSSRQLLHRAEATVEALVAELGRVPGVSRLEPAGSFRRRRETVGDLDLLAETDRATPLVERFVGLADVERVIGAGSHKAAVQLRHGPQVDLMLMPPGEAGTYLIHFTGSKRHNVRLREMARDLGWSLSEKGFQRIGQDGAPLVGAEAELRTFATEAEAYGFLGLPFIEPELREDEGEIEAALAGALPRLVTAGDLRGDLHSHSDWSDGVHSIERMAEAARRLGRAYQVLTDHTVSLAIARGLDPPGFEEQRRFVDALNERFAREEAEGTAPAATPPEGFRLLHGCELEIRADGRLDLPDRTLSAFDLVVASLHVSRRQPRAQLTERTLNAIRSPHVDVIAHPAGRMIGGRDDLDLDWDAVIGAAAATGTALEMNGSPHRLDLSAERGRRAASAGCLIALDSDAHRTEELDDVRWAVSQARRAWLEPEAVVNTRTRTALLDWVRSKPERLSGATV